jgi:hypothetical protein
MNFTASKAFMPSLPYAQIHIPSGSDGYTPIKGIDYDTPEEREEIKAFIAEECTKRGQLKPEFANDISECADTSKLYVLPDGSIYAYLFTLSEGSAAYNNLSDLQDSEECQNNVHLRVWNAIPSTRPTGFFAFTMQIMR